MGWTFWLCYNCIYCKLRLDLVCLLFFVQGCISLLYFNTFNCLGCCGWCCFGLGGWFVCVVICGLGLVVWLRLISVGFCIWFVTFGLLWIFACGGFWVVKLFCDSCLLIVLI